jgi:hypothetical protein
MSIKLQECTIPNIQNHNYNSSPDLTWQLTAEYESFLASVYFCRDPDHDLEKILLKDLCDDSYDAYSMAIDDNMQNRIGNWDTIQNFMTYVSLHSTATVYYKFLSIYIYSFCEI